MTKGQYVPVSVHYDDDDRVMDAGPLAETLHLRLIRLAGRLLTDGFVTLRQIERATADLLPLRFAADVEHPLDALVRVGLLRPELEHTPPGYRLRSWLDWNDTADEIRAKQEAKKEADRVRAQRYRDRQKSAENVTAASRRDETSRDVTSRVSSSSSSTNSRSISSSTSTDGTAPLPPLIESEEHNLRQLVDAIGAAGFQVDWRLTLEETRDVAAAIDRAGVDALVAYARRRHRASSPAFSARAWVDGWRSLPALRLVERVQFDPPTVCKRHTYLPPSVVCAACRSEEKAGEA